MSFESTNSAKMYELNAARTVLAALEQQEQDLFDQLRNVHSAAQAQRTKVEELIRQLPRAPISHLPNELLIRIFNLLLGAALDSDVRRLPDRQLSRMQGLAHVSRHWRDVILNSPSLWTTILVTPDCGTTPVKVHLHRSSQLTLDIELHSWNSFRLADEDLLKDLLTMLIPHAHRWRSFAMDDVRERFLPRILVRLQHVAFPSLTQLTMSNVPILFDDLPLAETSIYPVFFRPGACPRLKHLTLVDPDFADGEEFRVPSSVTTVSVHVNYDFPDDYEELHWIPSFFDSLSCVQLTSLTLTGYFEIGGHHFPPNSIQLPLLEKFVCRVIKARALVEAIVTPILSHMECYTGISDNSPNNNFTGLESKFTYVHRLILFDSPSAFRGPDSRKW